VRKFNANPIMKRGRMFDGEGRPIRARIIGSPYDGCTVQMRHEWTLGREAVSVDGTGEEYRVSTDEHGFVLVWIKPTEVRDGQR